MSIDQALGLVFSLAAQFGIDSAIKAAIVIILGSMVLIYFLRR